MKVSIIVPVYNVEQYIEKCLGSVELLDDLELIIIDDCSTDNTLNVIKDWISKQKGNIILLCNDTNKGEGYTINRGLDLASGEYIGILDSDDDYLFPISKMYEYFDGECSLVYYDLITNDGTLIKLTPENKFKHPGATKFYKRSFIGDTRRNENKRVYGDVEFYDDLMKKEANEIFTSIIFYHYNFPRENSLVDQEIRRKKENGSD